MPIVGLIEGSLHLCLGGDWIEVDLGNDIKLKFMATLKAIKGNIKGN